ncbi:MAG: alpha/beta hydrolase [Eubacterium sp.]|nr:alpha/beta hydrolase [Eubacterium sp.]
MVLSIAIAGIFTFAFVSGRNEGRLKSKRDRALFFTISFLIVYVFGAFLYFGNYYHASEEALSCLNSTEDVEVSECKDYYFFDGYGEDTALIFYQGAKVDEKAYAGIMMRLAKGGVDCFLCKMPLNMAFTDKMKAAGIISSYDYKYLYLGGHSLGGAMAGVFASEHPENLTGLIFLASYSTSPISDNLDVLSLIASEDKVLNWDMYYENNVNLPDDFKEVMIEGGIHSYFGDYGIQRKDGTPLISKEEQHEKITEEILNFIEEKKTK